VHRNDYVQTKRIVEAVLKGFPESGLETTDRLA